MDDSLPTNFTITWTSNETNYTQQRILTNQSSYTITGLTLNAVYTITVTATNRCGTGPEYTTSVSFYAGIIFTNGNFVSPTYVSTCYTVIIISTKALNGMDQ